MRLNTKTLIAGTALLASLSFAALGGTPAELATHLAAELEKWALVIKAAGIKNQ